MQTTGGANSSNNGKVEVGNRLKANTVRLMLAQMKVLLSDDLPKEVDTRQFWCFAYQYSNFILLRLYNSERKAIPYTLVHNKKPSFRHMVPFGAPCTTVATDKNLKTKLDPTCAALTYFLGYGNTELHHLVWKPSDPRNFNHSRHSIVEEMITYERIHHLIVSPVDHPLGKGLKYYLKQLLDVGMPPPPSLEIVKGPFCNDEIVMFTFTLDPPPADIGLVLAQDEHLNIPYVSKVVVGSCAHNNLPPGFCHNQLIATINSESPITAKYAYQLLKDIQK